MAALRLRPQVRRNRGAHRIEQQRILARPLRKQALCQAWNEDDAKAAATHVVGCRHEHTSVTRLGRPLLQECQAVGQNVDDLVDRHRSDVGHRLHFTQDAQHVIRAAQHTRHELNEARHPLTPRCPRRPGVQRFDDRQRETLEVAEVAQVTLQRRQAWRLGLDFAERIELQL